ncbi:hypothetical protein LS68_000690 [Helicobacter sp. MIT 05-5293]|uniref:hypothetical protein n=1 Tax=Helicobacter sp. MIT 05-5293 TaxID=1548149 RepID=UPI00051D44DC|nr:hypothetical protein [Helicobacter sp. MIT 05-5293]TLD81584.1 hypothetical protein LS68_000690 [Helicobacter sp. MIT 05-5293]
MKLYEYTRSSHNKTAKILGFTIMEVSINYDASEKVQKILGGLIKTSKFDYLNGTSQKEIKVLGFLSITRKRENNDYVYLMFGKIIHKTPLILEFKKRYFSYFDRQYDDIYILNANSGEICLTLTYCIDAFIKKNKSKNPLLVATKKYHFDMIKMLCPDIPHIYIKMRVDMIGKEHKIKPFRLFFVCDTPHFRQVEFDIKNNDLGKCHYFRSLVEYLGLRNDDLSYRKMLLPIEDKRNMLDKVAKIGLNLDKFVFLAPEAISCESYDEKFWVMLINALQDKGFDVFVNLTSDRIKLEGARDFKTCDLSIIEAFALAKNAQRIVMLRSGFTDILLQTHIPMDILYTKFGWRTCFSDMSTSHVLAGFGTRQIPFIDQGKIREFNMSEITLEDCLTLILEKIK